MEYSKALALALVESSRSRSSLRSSPKSWHLGEDLLKSQSGGRFSIHGVRTKVGEALRSAICATYG
eukprot:6547525-Pyramimonas_sp.AAC.1